ncbi:MAG: MBL fold metallo-hydrolase [Thermodesulfobacteriota bacterium]
MSTDLIKRLEGEVYFVPGEGKGRFPCCHGFLFKGSETVLMDAGIGESRLRELDRKHRIDVLIITHSHPDHIRNASLLHDRHLFLPRETPDCVMDLLSLGERFMGNLEDGAVWARFVHDSFGVRALKKADERYSEGQILSLGGAQLEPIHAPGHLIDHYCFIERNTGTLISTDIDLTFFGPWYGNPESNIETFRADVERLMNLPYRRVCSSHKEPVEGDATDLFENYLAAFERQKKTILNLCNPPRSLDDIAETSPFYHNALRNKTIQYLFERRMTEKNLELLVRDGLVIESEGIYSLPAE